MQDDLNLTDHQTNLITSFGLVGFFSLFLLKCNLSIQILTKMKPQNMDTCVNIDTFFFIFEIGLFFTFFAGFFSFYSFICESLSLSLHTCVGVTTQCSFIG